MEVRSAVWRLTLVVCVSNSSWNGRSVQLVVQKTCFWIWRLWTNPRRRGSEMSLSCFTFFVSCFLVIWSVHSHNYMNWFACFNRECCFRGLPQSSGLACLPKLISSLWLWEWPFILCFTWRVWEDQQCWVCRGKEPGHVTWHCLAKLQRPAIWRNRYEEVFAFVHSEQTIHFWRCLLVCLGVVSCFFIMVRFGKQHDMIQTCLARCRFLRWS